MFTIKLYGSNEYEASNSLSEVLTTTIEALSDVLSKEIEVYTILPTNMNDGEDKEAVGGLLYSDGKRRRNYSIKTEYYNFPDELSTIEDIEAILEKDNIWFKATNFPQTLQTSGYVINIVKADELSWGTLGKQFIIECKKAKQNA